MNSSTRGTKYNILGLVLQEHVVDMDNSETKINLTTSASEDSLDSAFMSRRNSRDTDAMDTKPLADAENYDSSW